LDSRVVNLRDFRRPDTKFALYDIPKDVERIDRRSPYGNPFKIGDAATNDHPMDREQVIALYRRYIEAKLVSNPTFLEPLRGKRLGCWCKPPEGFEGRLMCHGQIVASILYGVSPESVE
jgi:hypothetical protein